MQIAFLILMFILGAVFGSFFCCQVRRQEEREGIFEGIRSAAHWRVTRAKGAPRPQLCEDGGRARGRTRQKKLPARSICLYCKKQLKWYDNIPVISWLILRGKCRSCHKKIGYAEIISELACGLALLLIAIPINVETTTMMGWFEFAAITFFTLSLLFLAIYDGLTGELPNLALTISVICAIIPIILRLGNNFLVVGFFDSEILFSGVTLPLLAALLFGGIYLALYLISKGKWVGDGDWILAATIGLTLGHPWLAMIALFIANFSACLIMLPAAKKTKNHQIYFGPFLVLAFIITYTFSDFFISMI